MSEQESNTLVVFARCTKCGRGFVCFQAEFDAEVARLCEPHRDPFGPSLAYQRQWFGRWSGGICGGTIKPIAQPIPIHDYIEQPA